MSLKCVTMRRSRTIRPIWEAVVEIVKTVGNRVETARNYFVVAETDEAERSSGMAR